MEPSPASSWSRGPSGEGRMNNNHNSIDGAAGSNPDPDLAATSVLFANSADDDAWASIEQAALHEKLEQLNGSATNDPSAPFSNDQIVPSPRYLIHPGKAGAVVLDPSGQPLTVSRVLATKPLQSELSSRPGPGNKKLTYMSGESVTRLLNEIFGHDGWCMDVKKIERVECTTQSSGKFQVAYMATVRITVLRPHTSSPTAAAAQNAYREDVGFGDSIDKLLATAVSHAVKGAVTDALKRAARHFGDRLGNALSDGQFSLKNAPMNLSHALNQLDQKICERYNWELHERQMRNKKMSAAAVSSSAPSIATAPQHTSTMQISAMQQPQPMQHQQLQLHHPPSNTSMHQMNPPVSRPTPSSNVASTCTTSLQRNNTVGSAPVALPPPRSNGEAAILAGAGAGGASSTTSAPNAWRPPNPVTAQALTASTTDLNRPTPTTVATSSGLSTALAISSPPWNQARQNRPGTSSGRHQAPSSITDAGGVTPASHSASASGQGFPSKRPLEAMDSNAGSGSHLNADGTRSAHVHPPNEPKQPYAKKFNPYHQSL